MIIEGKELEIKLNGRIYHCALDVTMDYIGGKWKTVVLWYLRKKEKRFGELKQLIPTITEKTLSIQLKRLEKDGFISRTIYPEVPPRVEYALTEEGRLLLPILEDLAAWGRRMAAVKGEVEEVKKKRVAGKRK